MSLRTELQEVVKWIADLSEEKPKPTPQPPTREDWGRVQNNLQDAAKTLGEAHGKLVDEERPAFLAELATDLERQAEELSVRAGLLKRRAKPETAEQRKAREDAEERARADAAAKTAAREQAKAEAAAEAEVKAEAAGKADDADAEENDEPAIAPASTAATGGTPEASARKEPPESVRRLNSALRTVDTAHLNLEVDGQPDPVAMAFLAELEVLFEMTLSLRQRVEQFAQARQTNAVRTGDKSMQSARWSR